MPKPQSKLYKLVLRMPGVEHLKRHTSCWYHVGHHHCWGVARWRYGDWTYCWQHLVIKIKDDPWLVLHQRPHVHVDMTWWNQNQSDIQICWADITGTSGLNGEMSTAWFEQAAEEAWERLTPGQRAWLMTKAVAYLAGTP